MTTLGLFHARRWSAAAKFRDVLLFLLGRFQDLRLHRQRGLWHGHHDWAYLERAEQALVDAHHRTGIVEFTAVVGRTEQCHELTLRKELVTILHNLMGTAYEVHVVLL
jgi:hypothetical protein